MTVPPAVAEELAGQSMQEVSAVAPTVPEYLLAPHCVQTTGLGEESSQRPALHLHTLEMTDEFAGHSQSPGSEVPASVNACCGQLMQALSAEPPVPALYLFASQFLQEVVTRCCIQLPFA